MNLLGSLERGFHRPAYLGVLEARLTRERAALLDKPVSYTEPGRFNYTKSDVDRVTVGMTLDEVNGVLGPRGQRETSTRKGRTPTSCGVGQVRLTRRLESR